jgi:hypothetical protein
MLHFPPYNLSIIYIGVCDLGEARKLGEDNSSPHGFATKEKPQFNDNFNGGWR